MFLQTGTATAIGIAAVLLFFLSPSYSGSMANRFGRRQSLARFLYYEHQGRGKGGQGVWAQDFSFFFSFSLLVRYYYYGFQDGVGLFAFRTRIRHVVSTEHVLILTPCSCPTGPAEVASREGATAKQEGGLYIWQHSSFLNFCRVIHEGFWSSMLLKANVFLAISPWFSLLLNPPCVARWTSTCSYFLPEPSS